MKNPLSRMWDAVVKPVLERPPHLQVGALCYRGQGDARRVLLVTSRDTGRWIIPKGWPIDGLNGPETALREAWEEAGVRATEVQKDPVGDYSYDKRVDDGTALPVITSVYRIEVTGLADVFPESDQRKRCWVSPKVAAERVQEPELRDLLLQL